MTLKKYSRINNYGKCTECCLNGELVAIRRVMLQNEIMSYELCKKCENRYRNLGELLN